MSDLLDLGTQALVVERARQAARDLRAERSALACERPGREGPWNRCDVAGSNFEGDRSLELPKDEWCANCIDRQRVHEKYHVAVNRQRTQRMKLTKMAMRALPTEPDDD